MEEVFIFILVEISLLEHKSLYLLSDLKIIVWKIFHKNNDFSHLLLTEKVGRRHWSVNYTGTQSYEIQKLWVLLMNYDWIVTNK